MKICKAPVSSTNCEEEIDSTGNSTGNRSKSWVDLPVLCTICWSSYSTTLLDNLSIFSGLHWFEIFFFSELGRELENIVLIYQCHYAYQSLCRENKATSPSSQQRETITCSKCGHQNPQKTFSCDLCGIMVGILILWLCIDF